MENECNLGKRRQRLACRSPIRPIPRRGRISLISRSSRPSGIRKEWKTATHEEYGLMIKGQGWELIALAPGKNVVAYKWVFKTKHDSRQYCTIQGMARRQGILTSIRDRLFRNVYSSAKLTIYRVIFALAALN